MLDIVKKIKIFSFLFPFLFSLFFSPLLASACGISIIPSLNGWDYGNDSAENSFIYFANKQQKLIISRSFENGSLDTVWVVPIPADPQNVEIDVLNNLPIFKGYGVKQKAVNKVEDIRQGLLGSHIYPFFFNKKQKKSYGYQSIGSSNDNTLWGDLSFGSAAGSQVEPEIVVYSNIEKEGIVAEVLSAKSSDALYRYLHDKKLNIEQGAITSLEDYIGQDFAFVVSWISPSAPERFQNQVQEEIIKEEISKEDLLWGVGYTNRTTINNKPQKGLIMTFPAKKIFYPLKPGSAYPGDGLPETITVVGHVSPKLYSDIKKDTTVEYFQAKKSLVFEELWGSKEVFSYTKITIDTKPENLTQDLSISTITPLIILNAYLINSSSFFYGVVLSLIISLLAAYLSVHFLALPREQKTQWYKLGLFGGFTIIGASIGAIAFLKRGYRLRFIVLFSSLFIFSTILISYILSKLYG